MRATALPLILAALALTSCSCAPNRSAENTTDVDATVAGDNAVENVVEPTNAADSVFCDVVQERVSATDCDDLKALASNVRPGAAALNVPDPMTRGRTYAVSLYVDLRDIDEIEQIDAAAAAATNAMDDMMNDVDLDVSNAVDTANVSGMDDVVANEDVAMNADAAAPPPPQHRSRRSAPTPAARAEAEEGRDVAFTAEVARRMRATLSGQGFDIRAISPADGVITISDTGSGRWEWEVVPRQGGNRTLTVRTEAVGRVGNRDIVIGDSTTSKSVKIMVSRADRVREFLTETPVWLKLLTAVLVAAAALLGAWFGLKKVWKKGDA